MRRGYGQVMSPCNGQLLLYDTRIDNVSKISAPDARATTMNLYFPIEKKRLKA